MIRLRINSARQEDWAVSVSNHNPPLQMLLLLLRETTESRVSGVVQPTAKSESVVCSDISGKRQVF